jgi:Protein of unknown function (DUF1592)/Protein of unknown function (DUF1588)/Protein of unknown function (DUF1595)/Protein of unknown function (DUF1585)/Protein of unknown function (DUF1587)
MRSTWIPIVAAIASACSGSIGDAQNDSVLGVGGDNAGTGGAGSKSGTGGSPEISFETTAGSMPLRRLNRQEYANTLRDLLGQSPGASELFSIDESGPFGFAQGGAVSSQEVDRMLEATASMIDRFASTQLKSTGPCQPKDDADRACAERILKWFGSRAFRRTVNDSELIELMRVFDTAKAKLDMADALKEGLQFVLLSPRFHYRWERSDEAAELRAGLVVLTNFELASRLSYFLWQSMPDDELLSEAQTGGLSNPAVIATQVKRMLADAKASQGIRGFVSQWLPLRALRSDDTTLADHATRVSMQESLFMFVDDLILGKGDRRFQTLLSGDYAFVDAEVGKLLNLTGAAPGSGLQRTAIPDKSRAGIFTQPAFLAATADTALATIIHRGRFVFERLGSCAAVPSPSGAIPPAPDKPANASVREHLSAHAKDGVCRSCHVVMDPMGFAFDKFDSLGRTRIHDDYGKPATTQGVMPLTDDIEVNFSDAADLMRQLATQEPSLRCFARQLFAYGTRLPNDDANEPSIARAADRFVANDGDIARLMEGLTQTDAFFLRQPSAGEVLQ